MLSTIFKRRSIRKYLDKPVESDKIKTILRAAMYAPSADNTRPWHFIVVHDRSIIAEFQRIQEWANMLSEAPVLIVVCGDLDKPHDEVYYLEDCAAATQNMLLAAYELQLGTCWLGIVPKSKCAEDLKKLFNLPDRIEPYCGVAVGYPAQTRETRERYNESLIHTNTW
ncbi:MAG: nitroreductase family protein [Eubacteriales bacterium]|nr:nitroreductase family protein [Eubacteriales bacterium]MDD3200066.1 nitroreductase family protein [Eubacteriales bacterium]MDD4121841.1 nitroreductase family protein [Eubacteriales bacterium]MDD4629322.1 nitroreductase family protein [Eubacteriales bacterium]